MSRICVAILKAKEIILNKIEYLYIFVFVHWSFPYYVRLGDAILFDWYCTFALQHEKLIKFIYTQAVIGKS